MQAEFSYCQTAYSDIIIFIIIHRICNLQIKGTKTASLTSKRQDIRNIIMEDFYHEKTTLSHCFGIAAFL